LSSATIYKYANKIKLPSNARKILKNNELKNQANFVRKFSRPKEIKTPIISPPFIRIISHCLFDGCVINKNGDYQIKYTNSSKKEVEQFMSDFINVFGIKPQSFTYNKGKDCDWYECRFIAKKAVNKLNNYIINYSTSSPYCSINKNIIISNYLKKIFLRCFWADEGCIDINNKIHGKSKSLKIIKQLQRLHFSLGIKTSIWKDNTSNNYALYVLRSKNNLNKFAEIGFGNGIITRGFYIGLEKQKVFENMLRDSF